MRACGSGFRAAPRSLLLIGLLSLLLGGCGSLGCDDEVLQHEGRPNARGAAVVFIRRCARMGASIRVGLLRHVDAPPRDGELLFAADADRGAPTVRIGWMNVNHLEITHDSTVGFVRRKPVQRDLRITYVPLPAPAQ